jgi:hypothetical protein
MRAGIRLSAFLLTLVGLIGVPVPAAAAGTVKLAFFNIQSGKGEVGLSGRQVLFADTQNCTDPTQPVNAWGVGFVQQELVTSVKNDPDVIAIGLAEAWVCGSPENVRQLLGWAAKSSTRNGVAVVARYGFAGPESWQQLDTSQNPDPNDTMWVVRVPVCADAACSKSILMYAAHWYGTGTYKKAMYDKQAQQTVAFMAQTAGSEPHVLTGDLNAWEGTTAQCGQNPINAGVSKVRAAGYIDAWPRIHGTAEGFTGMTNRSGCGLPAGYTWKRIDYAWSSAGLEPLDITRFAMPEVPGDAAASDHYGIITTYPMPGSADPIDTTAPVLAVTSPAPTALVSGGITIEVAATDNTAVTGVEISVNGVLLTTQTTAPYRVAVDTSALIDGTHTVQARAYDAAGNVGVSSSQSFEVKNNLVMPQETPTTPPTATTLPATEPTVPPTAPTVPSAPATPTLGDIVLYAAKAANIAGAWQVVNDPTAAGGSAIASVNAAVAKLKTAAAAPAHYFEMTFTPAAGTAYRLWIRSRADKDNWGNDSVFVQFSGSLTAAGAPAFRIGTTASTEMNLEETTNAGVSGWGWQDNGYGANVLGTPLYFDGTPQTLRIQPREDGLTIDQIVLSPVTYLAIAPGTLKKDTIILPETVAVPVKPNLDEIVLGANAPAKVFGAWTVVSDTTAANGVAFRHPDAAAAKLATALAAPVNYIELTFDAEAGRPYHLWLRGSADRNSWANDSVFVQFSGAVNANGAAVTRIGTTAAASVNLEDASNAGLSGWGWQDNGYGVNVLGEAVVFETTGPQTIRIQTKEDGLRLDQIVLSSVRYLTTSPGSLKNDTTIVK